MIAQITQEIYQDVLVSNETRVHYQPIVSIARRAVIGYESLLRACYKEQSISPELLFQYAAKVDDVRKLDTKCQKLALLQYRENSHNRLLFINLETTLIDYYLKNVDNILRTVDLLGIKRGKVVIEINEKRAGSNSHLLELVKIYRNSGFLIALDDVGAGHSNLNRIVLARPDIVKVDRSVIMDIDQNYYKQEVLRSITKLGQKIGAITIAEGVETKNEVVTCISCGVDWFQGWFFSKAVEPAEAKNLNFEERCRLVSEDYQRAAVIEMEDRLRMTERRKDTFDKLIRLVDERYQECIEAYIAEFMNDNPELECIYLMDCQGVQITETMFREGTKFRNNEMFVPMRKGDAHISKPFYNYAIHNRKKTYFSESYISFATGNYCQTISRYFEKADGTELIVCADFITEN